MSLKYSYIWIEGISDQKVDKLDPLISYGRPQNGTLCYNWAFTLLENKLRYHTPALIPRQKPDLQD